VIRQLAGRPGNYASSPDIATEIFLEHHIQTSMGTINHLIQQLLGASPRVKWLRYKASYSPPSSIITKNVWSYPSTLPYSSQHNALSIGTTLPSCRNYWYLQGNTFFVNRGCERYDKRVRHY